MEVPTLENCVQLSLAALRPPERMSVSKCAEKYRRLRNRGAYEGPWLNDTTPYLVEAMDSFADSRYRGTIFVGPSQSGKTDCLLNFITYSAKSDPADILVVHMSQIETEAFSKVRVDKLHRDSPQVGEQLMPGASNNAIRFKRYVNGTIVQFGFPAITQLSGKPVPRVFFTDYDRMPQDVDGEGSPYSLGEARTTTFGRYAMCIAESSPGFPVIDSEWVKLTPHQAPPCEGIMSLYNRGDRRRWYWICVICRHAFEPTLSLMRWPDTDDFIEAGEEAWLECPGCHARYREGRTDTPGRRDMNLGGVWLKDGETLTPDGEITGKAARSRIASFWLHGPAAAFGSWADKVTKHLDAQKKYDETGSETDLQANMNTVWGLPYTPKSQEIRILPETLKGMAQNHGHRVVPPGVRFLVASIDVQSRRFEVQVHGIGRGNDFWIIDRFQITLSKRLDPNREGQVHPVRPFVQPWDWRILLEEVLQKSYPLSDGSGREMILKAVVCDSGGGKGTTANAYSFWRWLRDGPGRKDSDPVEYPPWDADIYRRFQLYKGIGKRPGYRVKITYPDSGKRRTLGQEDRAGAMGEIPLLETATNELKDQLNMMLTRTDAGSGRIHYPDWLPMDFYRELCSEIRDEKMEWVKLGRKRNESWDLLVMCLAMCLERRNVGIENIDWEKPPGWAAEWDDNDMVFDPTVEQSLAVKPTKKAPSLKELASKLA